jgi:serine/threonine-protein kinase
MVSPPRIAEPFDRLSSALADRYRIERELGAGGMATVYLAHDLRHERRVAIKVLKPELAAVLGAERFVVEIKTTASLQHPHILPLFDSGEADGFLYYVMPYIEGVTIRERLNRETQLGVDEAVRIAREIADALDYAHRRGVIHRDIKPENVLLHDGRAMVMDFGIALAVSAAAGGRMTETGLSLGTPHYMSPEQATAEKDITPKSDVYSLGAVLYEMLTGNPPHMGASAQQIIMKIITEPAEPVTKYRKSVPPHVAAVIAQALEKLPADRFESAKAFHDALANPAFTSTVAAKARTTDGDRRRGVSYTAAGALTVVAAASFAAAAWLYTRPAAPPAPHARFTLELPDSQAIVALIGHRTLAISPDGSEILYAGVRRGAFVLYKRRLDQLAVTEVPEGQSPSSMSYSPDGRMLAIASDTRRLVTLRANGGAANRVADDVARPSWSDRDVIVFARGNALWQINPGGDGLTRLTTADSSGSQTWPFVLPGGGAVLFSYASRTAGIGIGGSVRVLRLSDGRITDLGLKGANPRYISTGHILLAQEDGAVMAAPFDLKTLTVTGKPIPVLEGVLVRPNGAAMYDVSRNGVLVYVEGDALLQPVSVDRTGHQQPLGFDAATYRFPRLSPNGDRVAVERWDNGRPDIWILTRGTGQAFRLTRDGRSTAPNWSPDGTRVGWIYSDTAGRSVIRWQNADGSGVPQAISTRGQLPFSFQFTSDGKAFIGVLGAPFRHDILLVPFDSSAQTNRLAASPADELEPSMSADGAWMAFVSNETGRNEVFVTRIGDPSTRLQLTTEGATEPAWLDGKTVAVRSQGNFVAISLTFTPRIEVSRRETMFMDVYHRGTPDRAFDVDRKTGSILALGRTSTRDRLIVVTGWLDELRQRLAQASRR